MIKSSDLTNQSYFKYFGIAYQVIFHYAFYVFTFQNIDGFLQ